MTERVGWSADGSAVTTVCDRARRCRRREMSLSWGSGRRNVPTCAAPRPGERGSRQRLRPVCRARTAPGRDRAGRKVGAMSRRARTGQWLLRTVLPRVVRGVVAAAVLCLPVAVLAVLVTQHWGPMVEADQRAVVAATNVTREHGLRPALVQWQWWLHPTRVYLAAVPVAVWTWRRGLRARTVWGVVTMLVGWNLGLQAKLLVERARPLIDDPVAHAPGYSFPSGHAFNVTMMLTTALIMIWPLARGWSRTVRLVLIGAATLVVVLTALDRVFLGVHFPSDVTAGVLLALALSCASFLGFRHQPHKEKWS